MFFTFKDCKDNNINFKNILHIGAHYGEEIEEYSSCGVESVCWFEANSNFSEKRKRTHCPERNCLEIYRKLVPGGSCRWYCYRLQTQGKIKIKQYRRNQSGSGWG